MRKVIGIGETILDIIFKDEQPIGAVPGGSVFNGVISLGRAGVKAAFISETGNDRVGRKIIKFLEDNHVDATSMNVYPESKSPISLAFLDEKNDAEYIFYKDHPHDRVGRKIIKFLEDNHVDAKSMNVYPESKSPISLAFLNEKNDAEYIFYKDHPHDRLDFVLPDIQPDDIVMFGSYYAVNPVIRPQVQGFLEYARDKGAILYYDVNFRSSHRDEVVKLNANILENLEYADIVRGSQEDFEVMFNKRDAETVYKAQISFYCKDFIYTQGSGPVEVRGTGGFARQYPATQMQTVSTIGAGDNFNAGFIYGLIKYGITHEMLDAGLTAEQWDGLIDLAQQFSANVCQSINNSIDEAFANQKKRELEVSLKEMEENI